MAELSLNRKLNFVIPVEVDNGVTVYVHSSPIKRETFEAYYDIFGKTYTAIYSQGYGLYAGPRMTKMIIKDIAEKSKRWDGPLGVEHGLFPEVRRLTNVVLPSKTGWGTKPFEDAINEGMFNEDDLNEIENGIYFFTLASVMNRKSELRPILAYVAATWGAQLESLDCTGFANSLQTLIPDESTGEKATRSSIPS